MIEKTVQNHSTTFGTTKKNGKIPRYLYHLTSAKKYKQMQHDSFCRATSSDKYFKNKGVFMFDLMNFLKDWSKKIFPNNPNYSLQDALLCQATQGFHEYPDTLVLLRIPTEKLDLDNLKIRSQIVFFDTRKKPLSIEQHEHLKYGTPVSLSYLYKQKKCPIEYIYEGDIPVTAVETVGQLTSKELWDINKNARSGNWDIDKTLMKLFDNAPEQQAIAAHWTKKIRDI